MIKEFWQEEREKKRRQKQLKKQNRKSPKSKEQRAYKIFGVLFAFFLIFGSIFYACSSFGSAADSFSWDSVLGVDDEVKQLLSTKVTKKQMIEDEEINAIHWSNCKDLLVDSGVNVVVDNNISYEILLEESQILRKKLSLTSKTFGALMSKLLLSISDNDSTLIETKIYIDGEDIKLKCLFDIELSSVLLTDNLPRVFIITESTLEVLDEKLYCMDTDMTVNKLSGSENRKVLDVLNQSTLTGLEYYTVDLIAECFNYFAESIHGVVEIKDANVNILPMR